MKSIFLIKTPLQLLNAIEARHYFKLDPADCILIIMGDRKSQPQILNLAKKVNEWGKVVVLNDVSVFFGNPLSIGDSLLDRIGRRKLFQRSVFYVRRLNRISHYLGKVENIFVGYTRYVYMTHFINKTPHNKVFFLDDGNGTIQLARDRMLGTGHTSVSGLRKKIKLISKKYLQGIKNKEPENACFFTAYDITVGENDQLVKNEFGYLRGLVDDLPVTNEVYFIGSPLSEAGIISQEYYLEQLQKIKKYFNNIDIVYIAHRRDSKQKLDIIKNTLNMKVILFQYPIEYQLAFIGPRPKILASFFSAALDSCRLIFGNELVIIAFRLDVSESPKRSIIESIYDSYEPLINENFIVESNY